MIRCWYMVTIQGKAGMGRYREALYSDKFKVLADFLWPNFTVIGDGTINR